VRHRRVAHELTAGAGGHEELYEALAGEREAATRHLAIAFTNDPRTRAWAADDADLAGVELPD
jgi:hypothetical protein